MIPKLWCCGSFRLPVIISKLDSMHHRKKNVEWKCAHGENGENSTIQLFQSLTIRKYKEILTQGQLFYPKRISLIFCEAHLVPLKTATMAPTFLRNRQKIVFYYLRYFFNLPKAIPRFGDVLWNHFTQSKCDCIKVWATLCRLLRTHISDSDLQFAHPGVMSK